MSKKEEFKIFVSKHPELIETIKKGEMTWQGFYEVYDLYGESDEAWKNYFNKENMVATTSKKASDFNFGDLQNLVKKIDMNSVQKHIGTAQKAINLIQEFTTKGTGAAGAAGLASAVKGPLNARPINKFFED